MLRRQYNVHLESCFWVGNFNARYFFLGLKFQVCVFFWVGNMKLRRTPPIMYTWSTPLGTERCNCLALGFLNLGVSGSDLIEMLQSRVRIF